MKTINYKNIICATVMAIGLSGCSDFLDILPTNEVVLENFWTEKADVTSVLNGEHSFESLGMDAYTEQT